MSIPHTYDIGHEFAQLSPQQREDVAAFIRTLNKATTHESRSGASPELAGLIPAEDALRRQALIDSGQQRPIGLAKGEFVVPDDFDDPLPDDVLRLFEGG